MQTEKNWFSKKRIGIFLLSIIIALYWVMINEAYSSKLPGSIADILWFLMIIMVFALPLAAIGLWVKDKFDLRSLYFYTLLIGIATLVWIFTGGVPEIVI